MAVHPTCSHCVLQNETLPRLGLNYGALLDDYSLSAQIAEPDRLPASAWW